MKKIVFYTMMSLIILTSYQCEEAPSLTNPPANYLTFESEPIIVPVELNGTGSYDLKVFSTKIENNARTFSVTIDDELSSASAVSYTVPSSVQIPAGDSVGVLSLSFVDDGISNSGETLILNLVGDDDVSVGSAITINLVRNCPSDLAGTYMVVSSGTSTDGAPVNNPIVDFPYEVEVAKIEGTDTSYAISDGFAGVYQDWYCVPYGYCFETEGNFADICGELAGSWQDGFNSDVTLTGTDNFDGTMTITWTNGFGDTATGLYTKQ